MVRDASYPNPYHTFTLTGSKSQFLLPEFRPDFVPLENGHRSVKVRRTEQPKIHRRQMLKYGAAGAVAYGVLSSDSEEAEAGFFSFIGAAICSAAIGWLVEKVLDYTFADRYRYRSYDVALRPVRVTKPRPTKIEFHNHYAEHYHITNTTIHRDALNKVQRRRGYRVEWGVTEYIQLVDNNSCEIEQIKKELKAAPKAFYEKPLVAYAPRRSFTDADSRTLNYISALYKLEIKPSDVLYVQEQRDIRGRTHAGVAIKKGSKAQFLLDTDTA